MIPCPDLQRGESWSRRQAREDGRKRWSEGEVQWLFEAGGEMDEREQDSHKPRRRRRKPAAFFPPLSSCCLRSGCGRYSRRSVIINGRLGAGVLRRKRETDFIRWKETRSRVRLLLPMPGARNTIIALSPALLISPAERLPHAFDHTLPL